MSALKAMTLPLWLPLLVAWTALVFCGRAVWFVLSFFFKLFFLLIILAVVVILAWW
jgi:hypothetical protein